jgi:hypothetical protein
MLPSSGIWCREVRMDISEDRITSIVRMEMSVSVSDYSTTGISRNTCCYLETRKG